MGARSTKLEQTDSRRKTSMKTQKMALGTSIAMLVALGLLVTSCSSSSKTSSATTPPTTAKPAATSLTITAGDYDYEGVPATIPAGLVDVTFVNKGQVDHEMAFVRVPAGTDTKVMFADLKKTFDGGPFPASFLSGNGVPNTPAGKTVDTQFNLVPGDYLALCTESGDAATKQDGAPHFARNMYKKVTVTGTGGNTPPTAESTLTARDYGFDVTHLKAGKQTIAFSNLGPKQWHFADINVFPKGTTVAQAEAAMPKLLASQGPPPAGVPAPDSVFSSQLASPGNGNTFSITLEPGRTYMVICFISDLAGGPPHAIGHQMYKVFTVS
jgi:plastocyanin